MKINASGIELIKSFEGCRLEAYQDSVGVWTIGWGHTKNVRPGDTLTQEEADRIFADEVNDEYAAGVERLLKVPVNENQFAALVSFAFNLGLGNLGKSTLLRKLNAGDSTGASREFLKWNRAGGKVLAGLTRRRVAEKDLFLRKI